MPSKNEFKSWLGLSLLITIAIITFIIFNGLMFGTEAFLLQFEDRFAKGFSRIFAGTFIYVSIATTIVDRLNKSGFEKDQIRRWGVEALSIFIIAGFVAFIEFNFKPADGGPPIPNNFVPSAVLFVINFMLGVVVFAIVEIRDSYEQNKELQINLARAEKERVASQLAALQQKINPHFMFNSLAVLSELIHQDVDRADEFIGEFSNVYRYVLDLNDEPVVTVKQELDFLKSYLFLQKIRFGENLKIENRLDGEVLNSYIPPLSLQLLFENAIKHNKISKSAPLSIFLKNENGHLEVKNSLNLRGDSVDSKGVGLKNLKEKYRLISEKQPEFFAADEVFIAKIPLIKPE